MPNSTTLDPLTIAAWPRASRTKRTAIARRPQPLTRSGSSAAQRIAVSHWRISPYSAEDSRFACRGACAEVASGPMAYVFLPRDLADAFSPLVGQKPLEPAGLRAPLVQRGQALPGSGGDRRLDLGQPPAAGRSSAQDRPCAPRCGPRSVTGPTVRSGRRRSSSEPRGARPPRRGTHGTPVSSSSAQAVSGSGSDVPVLKHLQLGRELVQQRGPYLRPVRVLHGRPGFAQRHRERAPAAGLVAGARRADLAAEGRHRRRVDRREAQRQGPGDVAQLAPRQRRGEQDVDVAAAARRDVGEDLAAAAGHQSGESLGLSGPDVGSERCSWSCCPAPP